MRQTGYTVLYYDAQNREAQPLLYDPRSLQHKLESTVLVLCTLHGFDERANWCASVIQLDPLQYIVNQTKKANPKLLVFYLNFYLRENNKIHTPSFSNDRYNIIVHFVRVQEVIVIIL